MRRTRGSADWAALGFDVWLFGLEMAQVIWLRSWLIALGGVRSGLFSNDDALAQALQNAGEAALDPCWRMPLDDEYAEGLRTSFADVANVAGRAGGSVTAAKFLQRFVGEGAWAHLDIAGTAWKSGAAKGATGRPVPLLMTYLLGRQDAGKAASPSGKGARKPA